MPTNCDKRKNRKRSYNIRRKEKLLRNKKQENRCVFYYLTVTGLHNLHLPNGQHWKDQLLILTSQACVHHFYMWDIRSPECYTYFPNTAFIYFINKWSQKQAKTRLHNYLMNNFNHLIYIV
jgi:hypothetical protein